MKDKIIKVELNVKDNLINVIRVNNIDYISLTDLAELKMIDIQQILSFHLLSNKDTLFLCE